MKFAKVLMRASAGLEGSQLESMFLRYKELKKLIKAINKPNDDALSGRDGVPHDDTTTTGTLSQRDTPEPPQAPGPVPQPAAAGQVAVQQPLSEQEVAFIAALNAEVAKFNAFFEELEEDSVIRLQALTDELAAVQGDKALSELKARLVDFHGSCVLSLHWSLLNYGAINKILKKHDKRTGVLLRAPCLANVLAQPFNSTSIMSQLVKQAEELLEKAMAVKAVDSGSTGSGAGAGATSAAPARAETTACDASGMDVSGQAAAPATATATATATAVDEAGPSVVMEDASASATARAEASQGTANQAAVSTAPTAASAPLPPFPGHHHHHSHSHHHHHHHKSKICELSKRTRAALETWETLRTNVSTPSTFPAAATGASGKAGTHGPVTGVGSAPSFGRTSITSTAYAPGGCGAAALSGVCGLQGAGGSKRAVSEPAAEMVGGPMLGEHAAKRVCTGGDA